MKRLLSCFIFVLCSLLFLHSCGQYANKYFMELKSAYIYDKPASALIKYPSEILYESNEILTYSAENSETLPAEYQTVKLTLQTHDDIRNQFVDWHIEIAYAVLNNKLVFADIPKQMQVYEHYTLGSSTDSVIITIGDDNAYLVNLSSASAIKLFDDSDFNTYFNKSSIKPLVFARVISVSPDGRHILYISNRDYIDDSQPNSYDLYHYDSQTETEAKIMNFDNKQVLTWDKNNPNSFLYREQIISSENGARTYSPMLRHSLENTRDYVFLNLNEKYRAYEMMDDEHIYILYKGEEQTIERANAEDYVYQKAALYIANIYTHEMFIVDPGMYINVMNVTLSDTKEYLAFWGSYVNNSGLAFTNLVTIHIQTNDIVAQYEQTVDKYVIDSFYWCPDNILAINFINMNEPTKDVCRFHKITHTFKLNPVQEAAAGITHNLDDIEQIEP